jgi:hypothetical protein
LKNVSYGLVWIRYKTIVGSWSEKENGQGFENFFLVSEKD